MPTNYIVGQLGLIANFGPRKRFGLFNKEDEEVGGEEDQRNGTSEMGQ